MHLLDVDQCEWCADLCGVSRCESITGEPLYLCASCEDDLQQQIEDSELPEDDDHCVIPTEPTGSN